MASFPTIRVEAAFTPGGAYGTAAIVGSAVIGTHTVSDEVWTDITAYVRAFRVQRGASRADGPILRYEAGRCTITLDNADRRFDPTNLSGPYVSAGQSQVTPMRAVRILAVWDGTAYPVFRGYADSWEVAWDDPGDSTCTLTATDAVKVLSNYDRVALGSPVGEGEDSGARVTRVLDSVSWPLGAEYRDIAVGDSLLQGTTLDRSAWEELVKVQDSEIGHVYVDAAGRVVFRNRHALMEDARSATVQGTFGTGPDPSGRANLITNPSMESASGTVVVRENLVTNPSAEVNIDNWSPQYPGGGAGTLARVAGGVGVAGAWHGRSTWTADDTAPGGNIVTRAPQSGAVDGKTYTVSVYVRCSKSQRIQLRLDWKRADDSHIVSDNGPDVVLAANTWTRIEVTSVAPTDAEYAFAVAQIIDGTGAQIMLTGDWLDADGWLCEESDVLLDYFDGSYGAGALGPDFTYGWAGTAHASASQMKAPALTGWSQIGSTINVFGQSSDRALYGAKSMRVVWGTGPRNTQGAQQTIGGLTVGKTYTLSMWAYVPTGSPDLLLLSNATGAGPNPRMTTKDQWVRMSSAWVATATSHTFYFIADATAVRGDDVCYVDGVMLEVGGQVNDYTEVTLADLASGATDLPFVEADLAYDDTTLNNLVRISNVGGTQQIAEDVTSQQQYLIHTHDRTDLLLQTDEEAASYAAFVLHQAKDPELRFTSLTVAAHDDPDDLFPHILGLDFGDRISVTKRPPGGGTITREAFVIGVTHEVPEFGVWRTTWSLQSATKWHFATVGHSTLGVVGSAVVAY